MSKYFIKRCIGIPGDTLRIVNGIYIVNSDTARRLGNYEEEVALSRITKEMLPEAVYRTFPGDSVLNWNIKISVLCIFPKKEIGWFSTGQIRYYTKNYRMGERLFSGIQERYVVGEQETIVNLYFLHHYYFMAGDKVINSQDSRYWGLLPDDLIVGKAWLIRKSVDPYSGKLRWNRIMKRIK